MIQSVALSLDQVVHQVLIRLLIDHQLLLLLAELSCPACNSIRLFCSLLATLFASLPVLESLVESDSAHSTGIVALVDHVEILRQGGLLILAVLKRA